MNENKMAWGKIILLVFGMLLFMAVAFLFVLKMQYSPVAKDSQAKQDIIIPNKASASEIGAILKSADLINSKLAYRFYINSSGLATKLKPGKYRFSKSMSLQEIVAVIAKGEVVAQSFTIPEGYTVEKIGKLLVDKGIIANYDEWERALYQKYDFEFLPAKDSRQLLPLEGYLFPDTYTVPDNENAEGIIKMMLANFGNKWQQNFAAQASKQQVTVKDTVIIASMVEREAKIAAEREIISGVIKNRLRIGMMLQICPTVLYCINEEKTELSYEDLEVNSPYNTYKHIGLPPGPVSCPGAESIKAALNPKEHAYLYYVSKGDGSHYFSSTYQDHLHAANIYQ